jgi:hypothetical protein
MGHMARMVDLPLWGIKSPTFIMPQNIRITIIATRNHREYQRSMHFLHTSNRRPVT